MFFLLKSYVANENGNQNPEYGTNMLNFFLALSASDKRAFGFVSKNACSTYFHHVIRLSATNRETKLFFHNKNDIIELFGKQVTKTRHYFGDKSIHVAMSLGVDATIIFSGWQIIISHDKIIGRVSKNHSLDIGDQSKEGTVKVLKLCIDVKKIVEASEVKVAVVSFQKPQPGM